MTSIEDAAGRQALLECISIAEPAAAPAAQGGVEGQFDEEDRWVYLFFSSSSFFFFFFLKIYSPCKNGVLTTY